MILTLTEPILFLCSAWDNMSVGFHSPIPHRDAPTPYLLHPHPSAGSHDPPATSAIWGRCVCVTGRAEEVPWSIEYTGGAGRRRTPHPLLLGDSDGRCLPRVTPSSAPGVHYGMRRPRCSLPYRIVYYGCQLSVTHSVLHGSEHWDKEGERN